MKPNNWIPLVDYSTKHQVSISTLRRKIRGRAIPYKIDQGKYFLPDEPVEISARGRGRGFLNEEPFEEITPPAIRTAIPEVAPAPQPVTKKEDLKDHASTFGAATRILEELKKAYAAVLQEKEEQICQLKEEVSDLRTLARVLESENDRLRKESGSR